MEDSKKIFRASGKDTVGMSEASGRFPQLHTLFVPGRRVRVLTLARVFESWLMSGLKPLGIRVVCGLPVSKNRRKILRVCERRSAVVANRGLGVRPGGASSLRSKTLDLPVPVTAVGTFVGSLRKCRYRSVATAVRREQHESRWRTGC
jgi:hypothetical protein